jgi:hypothetical protein
MIFNKLKSLLLVLIGFYTLASNAQYHDFQLSVVECLGTNSMESHNTNYYMSLNIFTGHTNNIMGFELGGIYNKNRGNMIGLQSAGLANITSGNVKGFQSAGLVNISNDATGLQTSGIYNQANEVKGVQVAGIMNRAKKLKGVQIGLVNVTDSLISGLGIGLVNIFKKGGRNDFEISTADYCNVSANFRSGSRYLYNIIGIGYNFQPENLLIANLGLGSTVFIKKNWHISPEVLFISYYDDDFSFDEESKSFHLRLGVSKKLGGSSLNFYPSVYYSNIDKGARGPVNDISIIDPLTQLDHGRWGVGFCFGFSF